MTDARIPLAFDTETDLFSPGNMAPQIVCLSSALQGQTPEVRAWWEPDGPGWLEQALQLALRGEAVLVNQSIAYDLSCAMADPRVGARLAPLIWRAYDAGGIHCVQTRAKLKDIARGTLKETGGYDLATIAAPLGFELDKETWRRGYGALNGVPLDQWDPGALTYAATDSVAALAAWQDQEDYIARMFPHYDAWTAESGRQSAYDFAFRLMTCRGLRVDQDAVAALRQRLMTTLAENRTVMLKEGLLNDDGSVSIIAKAKMVAETWQGDGPVPRTAKRGTVSTSADTIEQCDHPALRAAVEYAHAQKLLSGYVERLAQAGGLPVHPSFNVLIYTGRASSFNPNIQQPPREPGVRECYIPSAGNVFIFCDYDTQEVRTFAEVLVCIIGRSRLAERYQADPTYDPHTHFAAEKILKNMTYEEGMARKKAGDKEFKAMRQKAKPIIFGVPGGMGPKSLRAYAYKQYGVELSEREAIEAREAYLEFEPYARDYFAVCGTETEMGDATIRQLYSGRLRGGCGYTRAANTRFQGLGADITKNALWMVTKACYGAPGSEGSSLYGCRPIVMLHDEIGIEAPEAYAHEAAVELERVMIRAMEDLTPHVPSRASPALMRRWSKEADAAFNSQGRYVCWEDRQRKVA